MEIGERKQYLENLLQWCNDIYSQWETVKPRFSKQFDLRSLEEWEEIYHELKGKLEADLKEDFDHYQRAKDLYDELNRLCNESYVTEQESELTKS